MLEDLIDEVDVTKMVFTNVNGVMCKRRHLYDSCNNDVTTH